MVLTAHVSTPSITIGQRLVCRSCTLVVIAMLPRASPSSWTLSTLKETRTFSSIKDHSMVKATSPKTNGTKQGTLLCHRACGAPPRKDWPLLYGFQRARHSSPSRRTKTRTKATSERWHLGKCVVCPSNCQKITLATYLV